MLVKIGDFASRSPACQHLRLAPGGVCPLYCPTEGQAGAAAKIPFAARRRSAPWKECAPDRTDFVSRPGPSKFSR